MTQQNASAYTYGGGKSRLRFVDDQTMVPFCGNVPRSRRTFLGQYDRAIALGSMRIAQTQAVRRIHTLIEQWYGPVIMELVNAWAHGQGFAEQVRRIYSEPGMEAEQHLLYSYRPKLYEADQAPASQMAATRNAVLRFLRSLRDRLTDDPQVFELLTQAGWRV